MALIESLIVSGIGVGVQTVIILWLYNHYIIPKIVEKVQSNLLDQMGAWVESVKVDVSDNVCQALNTKMDETTKVVKKSIAGKRGKTQKMLALAENYLDANLEDDMDEEQEDSVITEAITAYGVDIVNAILEKRRKSPKETPAVAAASPSTLAEW